MTPGGSSARCGSWRHQASALGGTPWRDAPRWIYRKPTGRPVHILVGDRDGYDRPGDCTRFVDALDDKVRPLFNVTAYPEATFAWDTRFDRRSYEANANRGAGGYVTVVADPVIAERSRQFAVEFFGGWLRQP